MSEQGNTYRRLINQAWQTIRQQLPHRCVLCHLQTEKYQNRLCNTCWDDLPFGAYRCLGCGHELTSPQPRCGQCQQHPPDQSLSTASGYASPVKELISSLKYRREAICAKPLAQLLIKRLRQQQQHQGLELPEAIVPVPLHPKRLRHRGFNQAELLGREVARQLQLPLLNCCHRQHNTPPQAELSAAARQQNLHNAFCLSAPVTYHHLALIDDVITTGATMDALAETFRQSGCRQLQYWSVAKTNYAPEIGR